MQLIQKGDKVQIIRGSEKPQTPEEKKMASGEVIAVYPERGTCKVSGKKLVWKHKKSSGPENPGGRVQFEAEIPLSSVMFFNEDTQERERVKIKLEKGKRVRYLKKSGKIIS